MLIGGWQKFSMLDYPEHLAAIIFTVGCNFRCHFCYNPMLVWPQKVGNVKNTSATSGEEKDQTLIEEDDLFRFLKNRVGKLEGIVVTGGEPTIHPDLPGFLEKIKKFGYLIKLDTNGTNPEMLKKLIARGDLIDYLAMDLKAPEDKYETVTGVKVNFSNIKKSIKIIMNSGLPYEFRTTVVPGLHNQNEIKRLGRLIQGAAKWYLQKFKSDVDLVDINYKGGKSFTDKEMKKMVALGREYVKNCDWR